jgi:hypothetical protein
MIRWGGGPWLPTENGQDVGANQLIEIRLADPTNVRYWYLKITGTDETIPFPVLGGVNAITGQVLGLDGTVTFESGDLGTAIIFDSTVISISGETISTTFGVYVLTDAGLRVGAAGETIEGNSIFGWTTKVNPLIRAWSPPKPVRSDGIVVEYACTPRVQICDAVYLIGSELVDQASAASIATCPAMGLVIDKPSSLRATVLLQGQASGFSSLDSGKTYYLSASDGFLSTDFPSGAGNIIQTVGIAASSSKLVWNPTSNVFALS